MAPSRKTILVSLALALTLASSLVIAFIGWPRSILMGDPDPLETPATKTNLSAQAVAASSAALGNKEGLGQTLLAEGCSSTVGANGFGSALIQTDVLIEGENFEINVPCRIRIKSGGSLTLSRVHLTSRHLSIQDDSPNGASRVRVINSTLRGEESAILLQLLDKEDTIEIRGSKLVYPFSIWIRIYGQGESGEGGGLISLIHSEFYSMEPKPKGEGIRVGVSEDNGVARFEGLKFESPKDTVLWAGSCFQKDIVGTQPRCFKNLTSAP